jgi:hypothetical protein
MGRSCQLLSLFWACIFEFIKSEKDQKVDIALLMVIEDNKSDNNAIGIDLK